jgi:hypothetical protein
MFSENRETKKVYLCAETLEPARDFEPCCIVGRFLLHNQSHGSEDDGRCSRVNFHCLGRCNCGEPNDVTEQPKQRPSIPSSPGDGRKAIAKALLSMWLSRTCGFNKYVPKYRRAFFLIRLLTTRPHAETIDGNQRLLH